MSTLLFNPQLSKIEVWSHENTKKCQGGCAGKGTDGKGNKVHEAISKEE